MHPKPTRGRKADIRARMRRTGESYSVAARRLAEQDERQHQGRAAAPPAGAHGHAGPDLSGLAASPFAAGEPVDIERASALIAACRAGCPSCQAELVPATVGDRRLVAVLAGTVYAPLPTPGMIAAPATRMWHALLSELGPQAAAAFLTDEMAEADVAALLEDALDHWAVGGAGVPEIITLDLDDPHAWEAR
ncbi:hypothetical protein AB0I28_32625 [Phytomonospora sp. NPDC050363]|uniref:hypothetical protein n=1 Tax=Phytomonospora sp. NPDC050363 TaxID=3155642 RepID=UPI00340E738E